MYKRSLASFICSFAPFLVPRRASHAFRHVLLAQPGAKATRNIATRKLAARRKEHAKEQAQVNYLQALQDRLQEFREQINASNLGVVTTLYPDLRDNLWPDDSWRLAQRLHYKIRDAPVRARHTHPLLKVVNSITNDYKHGKLAPHPLASVHLLSTYKESQQYSRGHDLWAWLSNQGEEYLDARVYGAAIELLAYSGETDLQQLEELYQYALEKYAGTFAGYHLSPNAVLPDRSQHITMDGMPMILFQGILTARLLLGDWHNAYMALDTALRLHPTSLPSRFFEIFCYERPIVESFKLFHMACRSLIVTHPRLLTTLLNTILDENPSNRLVAHQLLHNVRVVEQVFDAVKAYLGTGRGLSKEHLSLMVKAMSNVVIYIPLEHSVDKATIATYEKHNALIAELTERLVEGLVPTLGRNVNSVYHTLVGLAGRARDSDLLLRAFGRIQECGDTVTVVSHRSLITALGLTGNFEAVKIAWEPISAQNEPPTRQDWLVLAKSAGNSRDPTAIEFVNEELQRLAVEPTEAAAVRLTCNARHWTNTIEDDLQTVPFHEVGDQISSVVTKTLFTLQSRRGIIHNFYEEPFKSDYRQSSGYGISREDLRAIYDEMTTDPEQPPANAELSPAIDAAGYPLAEHRFENWLAINELLVFAEADARERERAVEEAIANRGSVHDVKSQSARYGKAVSASDTSLSEATIVDHLENVRGDVSAVRSYVRRLRGVD